MGAMASQITSLAIVYLSVYSGVDQRKHQRPASLAFVRGIHRWPVNSPHKGPVTRKMCPFHDVIVSTGTVLTSHKMFYRKIVWSLEASTLAAESIRIAFKSARRSAAIVITRGVIMFSPCVCVCLFVCVYVRHDICPGYLTMKDCCHTNNILQVHIWGCLVVQVMFHTLMTSSITSPGHKVCQILKSIYLRQYMC